MNSPSISRPLGDEFVEGRYSVSMHGVGLCDEYPAIPYPQDYEPGDDGVLQEGMVICVEGLAAPAGGREAVKLEEQVSDHGGWPRAALVLSDGGGLAVARQAAVRLSWAFA